MRIKRTFPRKDSCAYPAVTVDAAGVELRCYERRVKILKASTSRRLSNIDSHRSRSYVTILGLANHKTILAVYAYYDRDHISITAVIWYYQLKT